MKVFTGARIFDGERLHDDCALVVEGASIAALIPFEDRPRGGEAIDLGGGILAPGFIDWQINGGGGTLFNAEPTVDGIAAIAAAHRRAGVTGFLPTVVMTRRGCSSRRWRPRARRTIAFPARSGSMSKGRSSIRGARACIRPSSSAR